MNLVFFLEEPSAREMLKGLLPHLFPDRVAIRYIVFEGKQYLEKNLVRRLRRWRDPNSVFVVLRDQDAADCSDVKQTLAGKCRDAGRPDTLVRIACRELESWYFGDLVAVERGLGLSGLTRYGRRKRYRAPDQIHSPSRELLKITGNAYQKLSGSRAIGAELALDGNGSHSFGVFIEGIRRAVGDYGAAASCGTPTDQLAVFLSSRPGRERQR